ncbi:MAG: tRNA (guanosine(37)-N1)-methyltransferase TrmD [Candidatus Andersenbacteria bacterium]
MRFDILTLFPESIAPYTRASIMGRAVSSGHIDVRLHNIRDYALDKHRTTDDTPYGGGAGMVMKVEPIYEALAHILPDPVARTNEQHVVLLSARGRQFTQSRAQAFAQQFRHLVLICGRYEGVDQRVADHLADEELSIGPYVLAGGELAALVVVETAVRLIPGVLGNPDSLVEESFNLPADKVSLPTGPIGEYPQYTKPEEYRGWKVPPVLLSGNHEKIQQWRRAQRTATPEA